jgi:predicted TPR repeat methyltransferase
LSNEWDEYAGDWDSNEDVLQYSENAYQSLRSLVSLDDWNVLDFGCGTGCLTEKIAKHADRVVALDTSSVMLAVLEEKCLSNVFTVGEELSSELLVSNSFLQSKYDLIVASSVCGFLPDYKGTLRLLKSLLAPGGWFIQWDWLATEGESDHGLTKATMLGALVGAELESVAVSVSFSMVSTKGEMEVLMGVGRNA